MPGTPGHSAGPPVVGALDHIVVEAPSGRGNRGLWRASDVVTRESLFQAQLEATGAHRERLLERFQQNMSSARRTLYAQSVLASFMLGFLSIMPLVGIDRLAGVELTAANVNDVLFANAMAIGLYRVMVLVMLLVFGVMFLVSIMEGGSLRMAATLPVSGADIQRLKLFVFLRMYGLPFGVVLLSFPIGGLVLTGSVPLFIVSLGANALELMFVAYVLVLIAHWLRSRVFSSDASRRATILRVVVMSGYLLAAMLVWIVVQWAAGYVSDLYDAQRLAGGSGEAVNTALGLVAFPFSDSYLIASTVVPRALIPLNVLLASVLGLALLAGATYALSRRGNPLLRAIAIEDAPTGAARGAPTSADVNVSREGATDALMRKSILLVSRDMGGLSFIILPVILPLMLALTMAESPPSIALGTYMAYLPMMVFLLYNGLATADEGMGGVLSSLPFRTSDLYRARQVLMVLFLVFTLVLVIVVMRGRVQDWRTFVLMAVALSPLDVVLVSVFIAMRSMLFGRVNRRYTLFMVDIEGKMPKYVAIGVVMYILVFLELGALGAAELLGAPLGRTLTVLLVLNLALLAALEGVARRMFWPAAPERRPAAA